MDSLKRSVAKIKIIVTWVVMRPTSCCKAFGKLLPQPLKSDHARARPPVRARRKGNASPRGHCYPLCSAEHHRDKLKQKLANLRETEKHIETVQKYEPHLVGKPPPVPWEKDISLHMSE